MSNCPEKVGSQESQVARMPEIKTDQAPSDALGSTEWNLQDCEKFGLGCQEPNLDFSAESCSVAT